MITESIPSCPQKMLRHGAFPKIALDSMDRSWLFSQWNSVIYGLHGASWLRRPGSLLDAIYEATLMATKLASQNPMIVTLFTGRWALSLVWPETQQKHQTWLEPIFTAIFHRMQVWPCMWQGKGVRYTMSHQSINGHFRDRLIGGTYQYI